MHPTQTSTTSPASLSPSPSPWLPLLLATLTAIGPFSIDTYLPSFHEIAARLGASELAVQQTLTAYLAAFSFMTLWHGAISDRFGRRPVILWGVAIFALASLGCAAAQTIEQLWLCRALQGISSGAGIVVGRALVRDLYQGAAAQRLMAKIAIMFALAPAIAPMIGGVLQVNFGWRSVFIFLTISSLILLFACWQFLPETLSHEKRQPLAPLHLLKGYWQVLSDSRFLLAGSAVACVFGGFFLYVLSAPKFLIEHLHLGEDEFYWLFVPSTLGMIAGSWFSGRIAGKWTPRQTLQRGFALALTAALGNFALNQATLTELPWPVLPLFFYTLGMALVMPTLTLLALDGFPLRRGLAASCQSFMQTGNNALVAAILAPLAWHSLQGLASGMLLFVILAFALALSLGDARYREN